MFNKDSHILIIGLGLIGGSYARRLSEKGYKISAIDKDEESIHYGEMNHLINNNGLDEKSLLNQADLIILALYPKDCLDWIKMHQDKLKSKCLISDVCGIKVGIVENIQKVLRKDLQYLSMHPMAGKEVSGVKHADSKLFIDANLIITPTEQNTKTAINALIKLGKILGFKNIELLDINKHDEMISFLSQLPHAMAVSLMTCRNNNHLHAYTGDSFRNLTRIAKINENLWSELFLMNKDNLIKDIDNFVDTLQQLKNFLVKNDEDQLKKLFIEATKRRKAFDK